MAVQSERITILGTPDFKAFLTREAKREGVSMSELVRQRCTKQQVGSLKIKYSNSQHLDS